MDVGNPSSLNWVVLRANSGTLSLGTACTMRICLDSHLLGGPRDISSCPQLTDNDQRLRMDLQLSQIQCSRQIEIGVEKSTLLALPACFREFGRRRLSPPVTIGPASHNCDIHQYHMLESGREGAGKVHPKRHELPEQAGRRSGRKEVPMDRKHKRLSQNSPSNSEMGISRVISPRQNHYASWEVFTGYWVLQCYCEFHNASSRQERVQSQSRTSRGRVKRW